MAVFDSKRKLEKDAWTAEGRSQDFVSLTELDSPSEVEVGTSQTTLQLGTHEDVVQAQDSQGRDALPIAAASNVSTKDAGKTPGKGTLNKSGQGQKKE